MLITFFIVLALFLVAGLAAARYTGNTHPDYYLASSRVHPALIGFSAFTTANSGYMFLGFMGYTYLNGLSAIWMLFGWIFGDLCASFFVHPRFKEAAMRNKALTYAGILSYWHGDNNKNLQRLIGILSLVFLLTYASAQFLAGTTILYMIFDWHYWSGAILSAVLVTLYLTLGGMRASIWTDFVQAIFMLGVAVLMFGALIHALDGFGAAWTGLHSIDHYLNPSPDAIFILGVGGTALFIISWFFAGISVIAQPHIMIRFVMMEDPNRLTEARIYYYTSYFVFALLALSIGLLARLYLNDPGLSEPNHSLLLVAQDILPAACVGLVLAGVFASTLSTADSLILSCVSVITRNITLKPIQSFLFIKTSVVVLIAVALFLGLMHEQNVFAVVMMSWAVLGGAFGPLVLVLCMGGRPSQKTSMLAAILGGLATWLWHQSGVSIYGGFVGFFVGMWIHGMAAFLRALFGMRLVIESEGRSVDPEDMKKIDK